MVTISINGQERQFGEGVESWISQQVMRRKQDNLIVCVTVSIHTGLLNIILSTPGCGSGGGGRVATPAEQRIFDLWASLGLNDSEFTGGNLVAFLKQLRRNT
jgi:sulfur carrier protein ThiS